MDIIAAALLASWVSVHRSAAVNGPPPWAIAADSRVNRPERVLTMSGITKRLGVRTPLQAEPRFKRGLLFRAPAFCWPVLETSRFCAPWLERFLWRAYLAVQVVRRNLFHHCFRHRPIRIVLCYQHEAFQTCLIFDSAKAIQKCAVTPMFRRLHRPGARSMPPTQAGELKTHQLSRHQSSSKPCARESKCSAKPALYLLLSHGPDDIGAAGITRAEPRRQRPAALAGSLEP